MSLQSGPTDHFLTITCPDRPGVVHAVSGALLEVGGNINENAQFHDPDTDRFVLRTAFSATESDPDVIARVIAERLDDDEADIHVRLADYRPRVLIMVSKADHCLVDLLYRWRNGDLPIDIAAVAGNHTVCAEHAARYGVPFHHLPVTKETKPEQEAQILALVEELSIDLVVLARYMQILSDDLCDELAGRAINIHHSFLPGFKGAKPYHQAFERGVKLVGATAHFVTADLDEGPIIEQDVVRVTHAHRPEELVRLGRDSERLVLSRAVRAFAEDRIILLGQKTIVFG